MCKIITGDIFALIDSITCYRVEIYIGMYSYQYDTFAISVYVCVFFISKYLHMRKYQKHMYSYCQDLDI